MRQALGLAPLPVVQEVAVCPIHGVVHDAGPCTTDKPVVAVVVLGDGERVVRPSGKPPRRYYRPCLPVDLGEQVKLWGIDVEALLTQTVKSAILDEQWRERIHEV